ncbi:hypothetical protein D049_4297B, partial [Vibrio parahaemolyticus VPTS-2010]
TGVSPEYKSPGFFAHEPAPITPQEPIEASLFLAYKSGKPSIKWPSSCTITPNVA